MNSDLHLDEELIRRLPLPLAQLYRRAHNAKTPLDRHQGAFYLWEVALKLLGSVAIVTYAELDEPDPELADRLKYNLVRPSMGHWWEFVRRLVPVLADAGDLGFREARHLILGGLLNDVPRVAALDRLLREELGDSPGPKDRVRLSELFDRLIRYRNRVIAHGPVGLGPAELYDRMGRALLEGLTELLRRLDVLAGRRLLFVEDIRRGITGRWQLDRRDLTGESASRIERLELAESETARLPMPGRLYLASWEERDPLDARLLHPLVLYDVEAGEVLFLFARRGRKDLEYLSYTTGRIVRRPDLGTEQRPLVARVLNLTEEAAQPGQGAVSLEAAETPSEPPTPSPPPRLGDFELLSVLGRGGMAIIYRAWQPSLGRQVALKCLMWMGDPRSNARFSREIRALGRVEHPNLVRIFMSGAEGDRWFYAMELLDGVTLGQICDRLMATSPGAASLDLDSWQAAVHAAHEQSRLEERPLDVAHTPPPPRGASSLKASASTVTLPGRGYLTHVAELVRQAADAAHSLHEAGVVHRDIKPGNIMITAGGVRAVLMDLGLAQLVDDAEDVKGKLTRTRQFVGTLRYASPEQVLSVGAVDRRSDVYSLGATLYELLTLRPLFGADDQTPSPEIMRRIVDSDPERPGRYNPEISRDLEAIVLRCLEKDPGRRYATARDLTDDLQRFVNGEPVWVRPASTAERLWRWCRRHKVQALLLGMSLYSCLVTLACVGLLISLSMPRSPSTGPPPAIPSLPVDGPLAGPLGAVGRFLADSATTILGGLILFPILVLSIAAHARFRRRARGSTDPVAGPADLPTRARPIPATEREPLRELAAPRHALEQLEPAATERGPGGRQHADETGARSETIGPSPASVDAERSDRERRGAEAGRGSPQLFDEDGAFASHVVITRYPTPIALAYRSFRSQTGDTDRLLHLLAVVQAVLRYLVILGISDLFQCLADPIGEDAVYPDGAKPIDPPKLPDHPAFEFLRWPTKELGLGEWLAVLRETARALEKQKRRFLREFPEVCQPGGVLDAQLLGFLVEERNKDVVHRTGGGAVPRDESPRIVQRMRPRLEEVLHRICFVCRYPLAFAREGLPTPDAARHPTTTFHPCMGIQIAHTTEAYAIETPIRLREHLPFVVAPDSTRLLYLWPLLLERELDSGRPMLYAFETIPDRHRPFLTAIRYAGIESGDLWAPPPLHDHYADNHDWLFREIRSLPPTPTLPPHLGNIARLLKASRGGDLADRFLGKYRLLHRWAEGGFGTIYLAETADGRMVAVKVITSPETPRYFARFQQEFEKLRMAQHPRIIKCYEFDTTTIENRQYPWYSMDLALGNLTIRLDERRRRAGPGRLPWQDPALRTEIVEEFRAIADATAHLHGLGIIHRDLKPANVLIMEDGELRVSDFGLVKVLKPSRTDVSQGPWTSGGARMGTHPYIAPEQEQGADVDQRADVYSLGILLAELALGEVPETNTGVAGGSTMNRFKSASKARDPDLGARAVEGRGAAEVSASARLPQDLEKYIRRCTDVRPDRRFADARELLDAFLALPDVRGCLRPASAELPNRG